MNTPLTGSTFEEKQHTINGESSFFMSMQHYSTSCSPPTLSSNANESIHFPFFKGIYNSSSAVTSSEGLKQHVLQIQYKGLGVQLSEAVECLQLKMI